MNRQDIASKIDETRDKISSLNEELAVLKSNYSTGKEKLKENLKEKTREKPQDKRSQKTRQTEDKS